MADKVSELYADFSIQFAKGDFQAVSSSLGGIISQALGGVGILGQFATAIIDIGTAAVKTAVHYKELGTVYGINTQSLQKMELAGLANNVSMEKMDASAVGLQNQLAALSLGHVNKDFLEASARLGVAVAPGMDQQQVMDQLKKQIPQFIKAHGKLGPAMAAQLMGSMGMDPSTIQAFVGGAKKAKGPTMAEKQIKEEAAVAANMSVLSRDLQYLSYKAIAPLIKAILPLTEYLIKHFGGFEKKAESVGHFAKDAVKLSAKGWGMLGNLGKTAVQSFAAEHPAISSSLLSAGKSVGSAVASGAASLGNEIEINVYGVEDQKIAKAVHRAVKSLNDKQKSEHAMLAAQHNPTGQ